MYPKYHIFFGAIFASIIFSIYPSISLEGAAVIFLASFLIDVDHYLYYGLVKKDWNLNHARQWYHEKFQKIIKLPKEKRKGYYHGLYVFHGFEVLFLLALLGILIHPFFLLIFMGFNFHLFLDALADYYYKIKSGKYSLILPMKNNNKLKLLK